METTYDLVIEHGRVFDGLGSQSTLRNVGIRNGVVAAISKEPLDTRGARVIDAKGLWVTPGFIDTHTHYDAEVMFSPGLGESVRHGVTTVVTGSCSLSMVYNSPEDVADLYARVEALPYAPLLSLLRAEKDWSTPADWVRGLESRPIGPNVASMIGHSDIRTHVMGLDRATTSERPTAAEREAMVQDLEDAIDAGFVGLSTMTNPWDKLAGDRYRSRCLPSANATWTEYGWFHKVLRKAGRVLQSAPNLNTKINLFGFFFVSSGWPWRKQMKTTLISAADVKASPWLPILFGRFTRLLNRLFRSVVRWQALPCPFELYADGVDLVVFEEFGAGAAAMHLADEVERNALMASPEYRRRFRKDYEKKFSPRIWHRDFHDAYIVECPDSSLIGKSVGQVAEDRDLHVADAFLDLVVAYGKRFRWKTTIGNHRPDVLQELIKQPSVQIGFADSGAHLRNMGFYNFPLHVLRMARNSEQANGSFLSPEAAIHKLTGEPAAWFGLDAGVLEVGSRADVTIIDPLGLDGSLDDYHEAPFLELMINRIVRRNDRAVRATVIGGRIAFECGEFSEDFGKTRYGRFLRADTVDRDPVPISKTPPLANTA